MKKASSIWSKSPVLRGLSKAIRGVRNWFEGAVRWSTERSWLPEQPPRDAKDDLPEVEFSEIVRKCRYFSKNSPLCDRISDLFEQYTVGHCGLEIIPASSDVEFNAAVKAAWNEWCKSPDVTSDKTYGTLCGEGANALCPDGNFLILKKLEEVPNAPRGVPKMQPRIQVVEVHRLRNVDRDGVKIYNGIQLDARGRKVGYWIADGFDATKATFWPASDVIHVYKSKRPGQLLGLPIYTAAINRIHDLDDLAILQMRKAKQNARIANALKKNGGEFPTDEEIIRRQQQDTTQNSEGTQTVTDRMRGYQTAIGGEWIALNNDEDLVQFKNETPTVTEQWHWQKVESEICATAGLSRQLVFPESMQGTVARGDYEVTAATLKGWSHLQADAWIKVYLWWLEWAVANDRRLDGKPDDYRAVDYRAPRGPNVDVGWNSQAVLAEYDGGIRTLSGIYAELSQDWMPQLRQRAIERKFIKDLAAEFGIEESEIVKLPDAVLKAQTAEATAEAAAEQRDQQAADAQAAKDKARPQDLTFNIENKVPSVPKREVEFVRDEAGEVIGFKEK